jgi:hypothetical protein
VSLHHDGVLFYRSLFEPLQSIPGVRAAGAIQALPLSGNTSVRPYRVEGTPPLDPPTISHYRIVPPGYIEVMRIPLRGPHVHRRRHGGSPSRRDRQRDAAP